jgi:hypothetical protein
MVAEVPDPMARGSGCRWSLRLALGGTLLVLLAAPAAAEAPWQIAERREAAEDSYVLYVRPAQSGPYETYKIETRYPATPAEAVEAVLHVMASQRFVPDRQERRILEHGRDEMLIYTFIDMPLGVSDRDLALRIRRHADAEDGVLRISWQGLRDGGPAPEKRVVRISDVWGYWEFTPDGPGRSRGVYVTYADLGGSIPAWLVRPMMREQVAADVGHLRTVLEARWRAVSAPPPTSSLPPGGEVGVAFQR